MLKVIVNELIYKAKTTLRNNLQFFINLILLIMPFVMFLLGIKINELSVKLFLLISLIPIISLIIVYFLKQIIKRIGFSESLPVPKERFTTVYKDGEVCIDVKRLQELTLYMADLEDWFDNNGFKNC